MKKWRETIPIGGNDCLEHVRGCLPLDGQKFRETIPIGGYGGG
jgi:hypothetical protein